MEKTKRKILAVVLICALLTALSGCFLKSGEELYSLPKPPQDYLDLQSCIDVMLDQGEAYCAPLSGSNRQAVQLIDLDGDGVQEALAYMSVSGEKPLRVNIFRKNAAGNYEDAAVISGDGASFDSVEYSDIDQDGWFEIIIGRQMSDQVLQYLTVYDLGPDYSVSELMSGSYSEYKTGDLDGDGGPELVLMKLDASNPAGTAGTADFYDFRDNAMSLVNTASLSQGMESVKRIKNGFIEGPAAAIFVSGGYQSNGVVTDVLAVRDGQLVNVTLADGAATSVQTIVNYIIYPTDVDDDTVMELARPTPMPAYSQDSAETYYAVNWYSLTLDGQWVKKLSTYHNYSESWFFILPEQWEGSVTVARNTGSDEVKSMTFYHIGQDGPEALFTLYTLTSENREDLATKDGRFVLYPKTDTIYAAEIAPGAEKWEDMLTQSEITANFRIIRTEWITGET